MEEQKKLVCVVTGSNSGIGKLTAIKLARLGHHVIIACRNVESGRTVVEEIKTELGEEVIYESVGVDIDQQGYYTQTFFIFPSLNSQIEKGNFKADVLKLNLASLASVREFVGEFKALGLPLNALVLNAGLGANSEGLTEEGFPLEFGVNHVGHFYLTMLLLDELKKSKPARVAVIASNTHRPNVAGPGPHFKWNIEEMKTIKGITAYKNSKLANVWFAYGLTKKLKNTHIIVNAMCPGFNPSTQLFRNVWSPVRFVIQTFAPYVLSDEYRTLEQQADAEVFLATEVEEKGNYYWDKKPVKSSDESYEEDKQKRLWEWSVELTTLGSEYNKEDQNL